MSRRSPAKATWFPGRRRGPGRPPLWGEPQGPRSSQPGLHSGPALLLDGRCCCLALQRPRAGSPFRFSRWRCHFGPDTRCFTPTWGPALRGLSPQWDTSTGRLLAQGPLCPAATSLSSSFIIIKQKSIHFRIDKPAVVLIVIMTYIYPGLQLSSRCE